MIQARSKGEPAKVACTACSMPDALFARATEGAKAAKYSLFDFRHSNRTLGQIVSERHSQIVHKVRTPDVAPVNRVRPRKQNDPEKLLFSWRKANMRG
jgi:hypothetical protein